MNCFLLVNLIFECVGMNVSVAGIERLKKGGRSFRDVAKDREHEIFYMVVALFMIVPFLLVEFVPSADLAQHLSQYALWERMSLEGAPDLIMNWWQPNTLVYYLLSPFMAIFPAPLAGKLIMYFLALFWCWSIYVYCKAMRLSAGLIFFLSILSLNAVFYWGFISFYLSVPLLVLFSLHVQRVSSHTFLSTALWFLVLFWAHSITFLAAVVIYAIYHLICSKGDFSYLFIKALPALPVGLYSIFWFFDMYSYRLETGYGVEANWGTSLWSRLSLQANDFGPLTVLPGEIDRLIAFVFIGWGVVGGIQNGLARNSSSAFLMVGAVLLGLAYLFLPTKYVSTIGFNSRWFPVFLTFLILLMPAPSFKRWAGLEVVLPFLFFVTLLLVTSLKWYEFDRYEMQGLSQSLEAIPKSSRVLGLDFVKVSPSFRGRPYLHMYAYAQAENGADINFSFARHGTSLISYSDSFEEQWTTGLEWFPEYTKKSDIEMFDYVIVNALPHYHKSLMQHPQLRYESGGSRWVLYKVI